jgi:hypothetical protein
MAEISATLRTTDHARFFFMKAMQEVAPEVLEALKNGPYRVLLEVAPQSINSGEFDPSLLERLKPEELATIQESVVQWGKSWKLADQWCLSWAVHAIMWWRHISFQSPDAILEKIRIPSTVEIFTVKKENGEESYHVTTYTSMVVGSAHFSAA